MDKLMAEVLDTISARRPLEPLPVPEEVRDIRLPLGYLTLRMSNWRAEGLRKISVMRSSIRLPKMEIFAIEAYPESGFDLPLLAIDFSVMKRKAFVYINFIPLLDDEGYRARYIAPLAPISAKYAIVPQKAPKPWLAPYVHPFTIYAMPDNALLEPAKRCAAEYLGLYLDLLDRAEPIADDSYHRRVDEASRRYCDELSEKDGSRQMLGRFIGMKRANTIFREVIR